MPKQGQEKLAILPGLFSVDCDAENMKGAVFSAAGLVSATTCSPPTEKENGAADFTSLTSVVLGAPKPTSVVLGAPKPTSVVLGAPKPKPPVEAVVEDVVEDVLLVLDTEPKLNIPLVLADDDTGTDDVEVLLPPNRNPPDWLGATSLATDLLDSEADGPNLKPALAVLLSLIVSFVGLVSAVGVDDGPPLKAGVDEGPPLKENPPLGLLPLASASFLSLSDFFTNGWPNVIPPLKSVTPPLNWNPPVVGLLESVISGGVGFDENAPGFGLGLLAVTELPVKPCELDMALNANPPLDGRSDVLASTDDPNCLPPLAELLLESAESNRKPPGLVKPVRKKITSHKTEAVIPFNSKMTISGRLEIKHVALWSGLQRQ